MSVTSESELPERLAEFLRGYYREAVNDLALRYPDDERSLWVEFADLYQFDQAIAQDYLDHPDRIHGYLEAALELVDSPVEVDLSGAHVRVTDTRDYIRRRPASDLLADDIETYVAVEGQLARVTGISYRLEEAAYRCQRCTEIEYVPQPRTSGQGPHMCHACDRKGPFSIDLQESTVVDQRKLKLEEPIEDRTQSQGESVPVYVEDDLCHLGGEHGLADHAGERVVIFGIYRADTSRLGGNNPESEFDGWLEASAIEFVDDDYRDIDVEQHREQIEAYAAGEHGDPVELCKQSIAPKLEVTGELDIVLEAAVAWLFNSYRIDPPGLDQIRGDLHMALIGDPATGKSSILTNLNKIAPKSEFRSGTGLTKVGLTAATVQEEFAGKSEWTLNPGILPRANGGHCIIDEVDDVVDEQTKAIHDALEGDQMVKVDKAGISADLPTRTALLASGNPVHGRFDRHEPIAQQIDLDPALISRMDALFVLQDEVDPERDELVAEHVLDAYRELSEAEIAQRDPGHEAPEPEVTERPVPIEVFRTWIYLAREECFPRLTDAAADVLREFYIEVRNLNDGYSGDSDTPPATPRSLEAGIRLATAFARVELSDTVEQSHAERAVKVSKNVVGLNYDPETGEFDVGRVDEGQPRSQKDRRRAIRDIVEREDDEHDVDGAPIEAVVTAATERGFDEEQVRHDIDKLAERGELYRPGTETVRTT